jgi:hypothetical protein
VRESYSSQLLLDAPDVFLLSLSLPREDRDTSGSDGRSSVILRGENVARRPRYLSTQVGQGLNQDSADSNDPQISRRTRIIAAMRELTFEWSCKVGVAN